MALAPGVRTPGLDPTVEGLPRRTNPTRDPPGVRLLVHGWSHQPSFLKIPTRMSSPGVVLPWSTGDGSIRSAIPPHDLPKLNLRLQKCNRRPKLLTHP